MSGILNFYDSLDKQAVQGFTYRDLLLPVLVNNQKLLPFQMQRAVTGNSISVFKLVQQDGTEFDLIADVANIVIKVFDTFEQLIYSADTNLSATPTDGYYYIEIQDTVNTWYSDYFHLSSYPLSLITFGAYTSAYTSAYQKEGISATQDSAYFRLMFSNNTDLENVIYQFGYQDVLILDRRFNPFHIYKGQKEEVILNETTGKEVVDQVFSYDEFDITFQINKNIAKELSKLVTLDNLSIVLQNGEEITADEFDVNIEGVDTDLYKTAILTYRINYGSLIDNYTAV